MGNFVTVDLQISTSHCIHLLITQFITLSFLVLSILLVTNDFTQETYQPAQHLLPEL
jgi:hypothetical protein